MTTAPIILFGTGRCGSTILHRMFTEHQKLAWLSGFCDHYPHRLSINRLLMQLLDYPIIYNFLKNRYSPGECYIFWEYYAKGFRRPVRDLMAEDLSIKNKKRLLDVFSQLTTAQRDRLLLKITGWPRLSYLLELFEDAKFIHVVRDGRAVANSLVNVDFWHGWGGPEKWRWGALPARYSEEWEQYNRSFIVLAAIQWKMLMDAAEEAQQKIPSSRFLEVRYEDLCAEPLPVFKKIAAFSEVEWDTVFQERLAKYRLKNTNEKYTRELNAQQQQDLNEVLADYLPKFGYAAN